MQNRINPQDFVIRGCP